MADPASLSSKRRKRDAAAVSAAAADCALEALDRAIAEAERSGDKRLLGRLGERRREAEREAASARKLHKRLRGNAHAELIELLGEAQEMIVRGLSDRHPVILLPVRLETRFASGSQGAELRVRIFPDEISIAAPPEAVSDKEQAGVIAYWRARAASKATPLDTGLRRAYEGAWASLATRHGANRAFHLVATVVPADPDAAPEALAFDPPAPPGEPPSPRADALPDRFAVIAYAGGKKVAEALGQPIADDLALAPNATQAETWLSRDDATGELKVPEALRWLVDFESAIEAGMAVRIPLDAGFARSGFDRLVAIGLRAATSPGQAGALVESLLAKHLQGNGCGIVRAGTPTNNTESALSGWQPPSLDSDQFFSISDSPPDIEPQPGLLGVKDGWRLARLLGLSEGFARRLVSATATDIAEALAMNRAVAPGTIDDFLAEFLRTVVPPGDAASLHDFFVRWVSGRGHFPALRVGRQPYGIVLTSAWESWSYPREAATGLAGADIAPRLAALLKRHRPAWERLGKAVARTSAPGADPFQRLLSIIGLLASSAAFVSRRAVSDEYVRERLRFGGARPEAIQRWFAALTGRRDASLAASGIAPGPDPVDPLIAHVAFFDHTDPWRAPIVDRDPRIPLSERDPIAPFDGARNYLDWLAQASRAEIADQRFRDADGASVAPPSALLYSLLRHSLLSVLEAGSLDAAAEFGNGLFELVARDPPIVNVGTQQNVLRRDYLEVDAARLGLADRPLALADWALATGRKGGEMPPPAARIAEVHEAIASLAGVPTARLERLIAEHLDLCAYRLDAWITGLYAQRLSSMTESQRGGGFHLGAYGWVENLRPALPRIPVAREALPEALRGSAGPAVFEDADNGGFVHAPSLNQAANASVLRNAYLSHADSASPMSFAVNLSSARMRRAVALGEGVRNGQPIAALLGYQLERGLHEEHPDLELDQYIYALRDQFPLAAGQLTEIPDGTRAEVVEARNVVNGLDLIEHVGDKNYPWGLIGLPVPGSRAAAAIAAQVDKARDAYDAAADLMLSESVHQAVQGNMARTKASLQALAEPQAPPVAEVIRTPRTGTDLTFRVALALDPAEVAGWSAALSPRAAANSQLNAWLARHLPAAEAIQWSVADTGAAAVTQSLAGLGVEPIDLVLMSGERLGDRSSEVERLLIAHFRETNAVPDERMSATAPLPGAVDPAKVVLFDFSASDAAGRSLASLMPLLGRLRRIVTGGRAADARDFWRDADMPRADAADPTGMASGDPRLLDFDDLIKRLDAAIAGLTAAGAAIKASLATIAPLRTALDADPATHSGPAWPPALAALRTVLSAAQPFGITEALPAEGLAVTRTLIDRLTAQGEAVSKLIDRRLAEAGPLRATNFAGPLPVADPERSLEAARRNDLRRQAYAEGARAVFGPSYVILPLFRLHAAQAGEIAQALAAPPVADAAAVDQWTSSVARVRPRMTDLSLAVAAATWIERPVAPAAVLQLPFLAGTPWIGNSLGSDSPRAEWLSLFVLGAEALGGGVCSGLMIDDWTETVPGASETTGVAFNFNRPNATAPQALLVAVPPVLRGHWEWEDLVGAVHEGLDLARIRAVEPDHLLDRRAGEPSLPGDYFQTLPAVLAEFSGTRFATVHLAAAGMVPSAPIKEG